MIILFTMLPPRLQSYYLSSASRCVCLVFLFFLFGSYSSLLGMSVFFIGVRLVKRVNRALCNCLIQNELAVPSRVPGGLCRLQIHLQLAHCLLHRDPGPNLHVHCNQRTRSRR